MSDRRSVEELIRLGADLAEAKRQFPDAVPYAGHLPDGAAIGWPDTELMSERLTVADVNCIARGHGDYVRLGKRIGDVFVFETGLRVGDKYRAYGPGTVSGLLDRIAAHPIGREAAIAALDEKTWAEFCEKYPVSGSDSDAFREIRDKFTAYFGRQSEWRLPDAKLTVRAMLVDFHRWEAREEGVQCRFRYYHSPADGAETWEITRSDLESSRRNPGRYEIYVVNCNDFPIVPPWVAYETGGGALPDGESPPWADAKERVADAIGRVFLNPRVLRWLVESRILTWEMARGAFWMYAEKNLPEFWEDFLAAWDDYCAAWDEADGITASIPMPPVPDLDVPAPSPTQEPCPDAPPDGTGGTGTKETSADTASSSTWQHLRIGDTRIEYDVTDPD